MGNLTRVKTFLGFFLMFSFKFCTRVNHHQTTMWEAVFWNFFGASMAEIANQVLCLSSWSEKFLSKWEAVSETKGVRRTSESRKKNGLTFHEVLVV